LVLVSSDQERLHAETAFRAARIPQGSVHFVNAPVNTIWARDFGPMIVRHADGSVHFVDCDYDDGDRPEDDNVPPVLAGVMGAKCTRPLLTIEGGNLLSNGAGLCITTSKTVADNVIRGYEDRQIMPLCETIFQCQEVAVLEPLVGEPTGHVDMFATFTSPDTVVVGRMDPHVDPVNAGVLDRNAKKLAEIWTSTGPLRVERIPMPAPEEGLWRSFTNVSYFNGVLMMPTYAGVDPNLQRDAAETYRRLLPGWEIQGIDCTKLIRLGGAVHCVTLNLPAIQKSKSQTRPARPQIQLPTPAPVIEEREKSPTMFMPEDAPTQHPARPFEADKP
jgi:agmatine/peptidylarginine deiminase